MANIVNENDCDVPAVNRYLNAVAICNGLALLASQETMAIYLQRMKLLKLIQMCWKKGKDIQITWIGSEELDSSELVMLHFNASRNDIQVMEAEIKTDPCQLEPLEEDARNDIQVMESEIKTDPCQLEPLEEDAKRRIQKIVGKKIENGQQNMQDSKALTERLQVVCSKKKSRKKHTASTQATINSVALNTEQTSSNIETDDVSGSAEFDFICNDCGLHFKTYIQLKEHKQKEHASETRQERSSFPEVTFIEMGMDQLNKPLRPIKRKQRCSENELTCAVCNKIFSMKCELKAHLRIHTGERPFVCSICGKSFRMSGTLSEHTRIHTGDKRHSCLQCGKSFIQSSNLKDHLAIHSKLRKYICNICGQDFIRVTMLNYHMRSHTGEKPYCCATCGKKFALRRQLNVHLRIHNDEFRFHCEICKKKFKVKGGLNRHKRIHLEVKPFSCNICFRVFTQAGNLRVHMRTHTGEKPFICIICGLKFPHQPTLKKHLQTHENEDLPKKLSKRQ